MTKEEARLSVMGAISMALKDPTLQQGFEIICKNLAELERKLEQTEKDLADYQFNYPTIKELQKELDYQKQARSIAENAVVDLTKENAEVKEILRSLYFIIQSRIDYENNIGITDEMWRAEQFLNEVEK